MEKGGTSAASPLTGPNVIKIEVASPLGPLSKKTDLLTVPQTCICLANPSFQPVSIERTAFDPLHHSETGATAGSSFEIVVKQSLLGAGENTSVMFSGRMPAVPGVYLSTLNITTNDGSRLAIRTEFHVAANAAWGIACMIAGLSLVGFITLLEGENGVQGELHQVLAARQAAHEFFQQTPPPQSRSALVDDINREFGAAIASLQSSRELSFVDHRIANAEEHLKVAKDGVSKLHKDLSDKLPGRIEVAELAQEWATLHERIGALSKQFPVTAPTGDTLAQRLGAFDAWAAQRTLHTALTYYDVAFAYQVNNVQLLYAAGRGSVAAGKAVATRRWMQRAADVVNTQAQRQMFFVQQSANEITKAERVRQRVNTEGITEAQRASILSSLNKAESLLANPFKWSVRVTVAQLIQNADTEMMRAEAAATVAAAQRAAVQEEKEDSIEGVQRVIDEGAKLPRGADGKIDAKAKMAWLRRGIAAWRDRLASLPDANPPALRAELDALEQAVDAGNLDAISAHSRGLFEQWANYGSARARSLILKTTAPFCLRLRDDSLISLESTRQTMRSLESITDFGKWESELDRLRLKTESTPDTASNMPNDCLDAMVKLSANVFQLSNEVDNAIWSVAKLSDASKRDLAADLGNSLTPEVLRSLISDTRALKIAVTTPLEERHVDRQIEFKMENIEPVWGLGVSVKIDFGDGSSKELSAEDLYRNSSVMHAYASPKRYTISVVAREAVAATTMRPSKVFGEGELKDFEVFNSPISVASRLADTFFNARFALALMVAGLVYFWRFRATKDVFGAKAFDYAQAFALGFVVSLAVNDLPKILAEFIK